MNKVAGNCLKKSHMNMDRLLELKLKISENTDEIYWNEVRISW